MVSKMVLLVAHGNRKAGSLRHGTANTELRLSRLLGRLRSHGGFVDVTGKVEDDWRCPLSVHAFERKIAGNQSFPFGSNSVRCGTLACKTPDPCFFCGNSIFEAFGFGTAPKIYPPCRLFKSDLFSGYLWVWHVMTVFMSNYWSKKALWFYFLDIQQVWFIVPASPRRPAPVIMRETEKWPLPKRGPCYKMKQFRCVTHCWIISPFPQW